MEAGRTNERSSPIVPYNNKGVIEDPAQCQDLLIEILCRLTATKSVFRFKCVSKEWYSLISSPGFMRLYLNHQVHRKNDNDGTKSFILECPTRFEDCRFVVSDNPMSCFQRFGLEKHIAVAKYLQIETSCNDLLLCSEVNVADSHLQFFVLNAFTGEYATIPAPSRNYLAPSSVGFVSEPYCYRDDQGDCIINASYRYRGLCFFRRRARRDFIQTYCSETKAWSSELVADDEIHERCSNIVAYNEKLCWYNGKHIVICDPFSSDTGFPSFTFLDGTAFGPRGYICFDVMSDSLRMTKFWGHRRSGRIDVIFSLFKEHKAGGWGWRYGGQYFSKDEMNTLPARVVGLHPSDDHIAYLEFGNKLILCNWKTRELKEVGVFHETRHRRGFFPISLPLWPTPTH